MKIVIFILLLPFKTILFTRKGEAFFIIQLGNTQAQHQDFLVKENK